MISILFYDNVAILSFDSNIGSRIPISTMPNNNTKIHKKTSFPKEGSTILVHNEILPVLFHIIDDPDDHANKISEYCHKE